MAVSFSRPDPSAPAAVAEASFPTARRGFDQGEVRDFLRMVAAELGRLQERERFLERELRAAQTNPDFSSARLDDTALTRLLGEETARVLTTARESANEIREKAEAAAAQLVAEASDEARRVREEADVEASRRRSDAASDAESELAMAKQQGREMVNEARAYRERVLSELARRRELAREQIEQLVHGRDRLIQVFERARLVAADVVSDLQPLGEPDEYVNLAPTTGPVPVMVKHAGPATQRLDVLDLDAMELADGAPSSPGPSGEAPGAGTAGDERTGAPYDLEAEPSDDRPEQPVVDGADGGDVAGDGVDDGDVDGGDLLSVDQHPEAQHTDRDDGVHVADADRRADDDGRVETDDVVVDLFARLRADAGAMGQPVAAHPAHGEPDGADAGDGIDVDVDVEVDDASARAEQLDELDDDSPFRRRDEDLTPLIVASARTLKRVLADEQNGVLDTLRRSTSVQSIDDVLPPLDEHANRYAAAIADDLLVAAHAGAALVSGDTVASLPKEDAAAATAAATTAITDWLVSPLRERLARVVTDGAGDRDAITKRVRAVYREWKTQHIDAQLDDVLRAAHGRGLVGGVPRGSLVVWTADDVGIPCADCNDNVLAGPVTVGSELPTGDVFAPAHPGCRCLLLPADR